MRPEGRRGLADRAAVLLATGFGAGYAPLAPGTVGSVPGVVAAAVLLRWGGGWALAFAAIAVTIAGLWASDRAARLFGEEDPGRVVIDEVAGQMIALCFLPPTLPVLAAAFFFFRLFDVLKPWPARRLEDLPGGSGIMADDVAAGLYANLVVQAALAVLPPGWTGSGGA